MTADLSRELRVAEAAVLRAALLTKTVQASVKEITKDDKSPVTVADFAAQALMISALQAAFPDDGFVGEEAAGADPQLAATIFHLVNSTPAMPGPEGKDLAKPRSVNEMLQLINLGGLGRGRRGHGRFWVMDPVDGTKTFLRGQQYAISLSLLDENAREILGVLCCPNLRLTDEHGLVEESSVDTKGLGIMLSAVRGKGASVRYLTGVSSANMTLPEAHRIRPLPPPETPEQLRFVDCRKSPASDHGITAELACRLGATYPGTEVWSSHMRYAAMIIGGGDILVRVPKAGSNFRTCIWDHAGSQLIFAEAGGTVTDLDGKAMDFGAGRELTNNRGMIIVRGETLHKRVLEELTRLLA
jgi:3'(2'), 5'-bisphosphate nucleotidase